jgi:hypothetical protein
MIRSIDQQQQSAMKKVIAAAPGALLVVALLGCSQHQATAPAAARPDNTAGTSASSDVNTFGDSKEQAASDAERARNQNYGVDKDAGNPADHP